MNNESYSKNISYNHLNQSFDEELSSSSNGPSLDILQNIQPNQTNDKLEEEIDDLKIDIIKNLKKIPDREPSPNILISMNLEKINNDYDSLENESESKPIEE